jgi:hypothetical protein
MARVFLRLNLNLPVKNSAPEQGFLNAIVNQELRKSIKTCISYEGGENCNQGYCKKDKTCVPIAHKKLSNALNILYK